MAKVTRRGFLRTVVITAGAAGAGPAFLGCEDPSRPTAEVFPQSIASGDPRADSIVLWVRALPEIETEDAALKLEIAADADFSIRLTLSATDFVAAADHDHCARIKVTGLSAGATYFYRFEHAGTRSNVGRFRTAAATTNAEDVRFAFVSCQDFVGRYYNTLLRLLDDAHDDLAFIVHLGDYVYETTGDPLFMMTGSPRTVTLRAPEEAIALGDPASPFYAARSVSNYRDLYRAYRSDPILQRLHERFAFICIWDDHEFSDDSWQDHGTYTDGVLDEQDTDRRTNADQVYFEYMPIAREDEGEGALALERAQLYPNTRLYRSFRFGAHVTLAMTDYRSFRPDHPVPEDAFPGQIVVDEGALRTTLGVLEDDGDLPEGQTAVEAFDEGGFHTYVDLGAPAYADHAAALEILLTAGYAARGVPADRAAVLAARYAQGNVDAAILQNMIEENRASLPAALQGASAIDPTDVTLPRGVPWAMLAKGGLTGQLGARYLVVQRAYDIIQAFRTRVENDTAHDDVFGNAQEVWLSQTLAASDATWNLVGNSVCNTSLVLDLGPFAAALPPGLPPERYYLTVDHWDGFPERRRRLMRDVYGPANAVLLAGDIHSSYATEFPADPEGNRVIELTTPAVSSATFHDLLLNTANSVPAIRDSGVADDVVNALGPFVLNAFEPLKMAEPNLHGVAVVTVGATELRADFHFLPPELAADDHYDDPAAIAGQWRTASFTVAKENGKNGPLTPVES
jgi:alkaline phosphatase D